MRRRVRYGIAGAVIVLAIVWLSALQATSRMGGEDAISIDSSLVDRIEFQPVYQSAFVSITDKDEVSAAIQRLNSAHEVRAIATHPVPNCRLRVFEKDGRTAEIWITSIYYRSIDGEIEARDWETLLQRERGGKLFVSPNLTAVLQHSYRPNDTFDQAIDEPLNLDASKRDVTTPPAKPGT